MPDFQNFIAGQWVAPTTGAYFENRNPATRVTWSAASRSPGPPTSRGPSRAPGAASSSGAAPPPRRAATSCAASGDLLSARKEEIANLMTREMGKPLQETRGDVQEGIDTAYYAGVEGPPPVRHTVPSELRASGR
jgi:aldehyde dehydrogenase (NAD+)